MIRFDYRQQYDDERDAEERNDSNSYSAGDTLTQQQFAEDADINIVLKRFGVTDGALPPVAIDPTYFGDFADATDFREALDRTQEAREHFALLPANLRAKWNNNPYELWQWINDPANIAEAIELQMLVKPEATAPVPPITPPPSPA